MLDKHTPGPWELDSEYWDDVRGRNGELLANVYGRKNEEEARANARLIATTPELLEVLQGIIEIGKRDLTNPKYDSYFKAAKAAIAKARGAVV